MVDNTLSSGSKIVPPGCSILCETDWLQIYAQLFGFSNILQRNLFFRGKTGVIN
jgi:hypothetical protein